jgi:SAM-dependent methyltransferase
MDSIVDSSFSIASDIEIPASFGSGSPYRLKFDRFSSHSVILSYLSDGRGQRLLDVGASQGNFAHLLEKRQYEVTAIEGDPRLATIAPTKCTRVIKADLDQRVADFGGPFDVILYAEVLEHLRNPLKVLTEINRQLKPGGFVIVSVPNKAHLWVRIQMCLGRFEYAERVILDQAHLRFFTLKSFRALLHAAGLEAIKLRTTPAPVALVVPERYHGKMLDVAHSVNAALARCWKTMFAYQFIVRARRRSPDESKDHVHHVILVDDGSTDETLESASKLNLEVFVHTRNFGYGANQKTFYAEALKAGAQILVMVHPDHQYDPTLLPEIIAPMETGDADLVLGSRLKEGSAIRLGMPSWKYISNRFLSWLENVVFGLDHSEFHTGYRAFRRDVLETVNFAMSSDGFVFGQEIIAQAVAARFRIGEIAVPVRYFAEASSASFVQSTIYGLKILVLLCRFLLHKRSLMRSRQFESLRARYRRSRRDDAESLNVKFGSEINHSRV